MRILHEVILFLYALLLGLLMIFALAGFADLFTYLFFGWSDYLGSWPAVNASASLLYAPQATGSTVASTLSILIGFGLMARVIMGSKRPFFLPSPKRDSQ